MSMEDPFLVVKDEVFKALNKTRGLYLRWRDLVEDFGKSAEIELISTELRNSLRSIEWDLEDLEDTISIVEKNANKFRIDKKELAARKHFITSVRYEVKQMKETMNLNGRNNDNITADQPLLKEYNGNNFTNDREYLVKNTSTNIDSGILVQNSIVNNSVIVTNSLVGTMAAATRHIGTKYSKLENTVDSPKHYATAENPHHDFIGQTVTIQQGIIQGQEEQLDMISGSIGTLKTVSRQIGVELDEHAVMLDDFGNEFDATESKLDSTMKKLAKLFHINNDRRQWAAIIFLSILLFIVIILFVIL